MLEQAGVKAVEQHGVFFIVTQAGRGPVGGRAALLYLECKKTLAESRHARPGKMPIQTVGAKEDQRFAGVEPEVSCAVALVRRGDDAIPVRVVGWVYSKNHGRDN